MGGNEEREAGVKIVVEGDPSDSTNENCNLGIMFPYDDGGKMLLKWANARSVHILRSKHNTDLGVVFCIP